MNKKVKIVMVGGGSVTWSPMLINDLMLTPGLQNAQYVILDIDSDVGTKMVQLGQKLSKDRGLECTFHYTTSEKDAFTEADFVIITISTGGLDAMSYDLSIPEDYKIYQTVGDTVGPGGWIRSLRNISVFVEMAKNIERYSPNAIVLNYTNPMAVLTNVFYKVSKLKTVGLCHGLYGVYDTLMKIFNLESEEEIKVRFAGTNHFFWILDMKIRGEDGYELLRHKLKGRQLDEIINNSHVDSVGIVSESILVSSELFDTYGFLPPTDDRHVCEFLPFYLTGDIKKIEKYKIHRTTIEERRIWRKDGLAELEAYINGTEKLPDKRSRETAADIISAFVNGKEFVDVTNLPNQGQISNLPVGSIVETLGMINTVGFTPIGVGNLPEQILNLVLPHVKNQDLTLEAGLEGDLDKALWALYNDPLCAHLTIPEIKEMALRLLKAHEQFLPQFFKRNL